MQERVYARESHPATLICLVMVGALVLAACTSDGEEVRQGETGSTPIEGPMEVEDPMAAVNASVRFESTGNERAGWSWLEGEGQTARWEYSGFPEDLTDLVVEAVVAVPVASPPSHSAAAPEAPTVQEATMLALAYGQGDQELGTTEVVLQPGPAPAASDIVASTGMLAVGLDALPEGMASMWFEATTVPGEPLGVRAESLRFAPLRLDRASDEATAVPPPPGEGEEEESAIAVAPDAAATISGEFSSDGDYIVGWWWLRDPANTQTATWVFQDRPEGDLQLDLRALATDQVDGGPGVDARFYLLYGPVGGGALLDPTAALLVEIPNVSPPDDPVGYTTQGTVMIPAANVPGEGDGIWVRASRVIAGGVEVTEPGGNPGDGAPVSEHVAFNAESVVLSGSDAGTTDGSDGTTEGTEGGAEDGTGPGSDTDATDDADAMGEADDVGDLDPGTYEGTLEGDDVDDWFAFQLDGTQLADIDVQPAGGLTVETELYSPGGDRREPMWSEIDRETFTHAAALGDGGRWYLRVHRISGSGSYIFDIGVRDPDDALQGADAGDQAGDPMTVVGGQLPGTLFREDVADHYAVDLQAGQRLAVTLDSISREPFEIELRDDDGTLLDDGLTADGEVTLDAQAGDSPMTVGIRIERHGGLGGDYLLQLAPTGLGECANDPIASASFSSSGSRTSQVAGEQPNWFWLQADADHPEQQTATWLFDTLPALSDARFVIRVPVEVPMGASQLPPAAVYVTYGTVPVSSTAVHGPQLVTLNVTPAEGTLTGYTGSAELVVPAVVASDADDGFWVRIGLADPSGQHHAMTRVGVGASPLSLGLCVEGGETRDLGGPGEPPDVQVTYEGDARALQSSGSIFTDPATDIDGDGLNQSWEDAAAELANPIVEVDEEEMWLHSRDDLATTNFVAVSPWPSYQNPTHVLLSYLSTWAYDPGGGLQQPANLVMQSHRGDSERIQTAWRIVDDERVELEWVYTSAHKSYTDHSAVWHVSDRQCNIANTARVSPDVGGGWILFGYGFTEVMCGSLTFDGDGRLVMYTAENKHAMYPTTGVCESVTIARDGSGVPLYGEDCGWDTWDWLPWTWDDDDFDDDDRYQGGGRWLFDVYNVGEPGYPLIDDLGTSSGWLGLSEAEAYSLIGSYPGEKVWSGRYEDTDECRGSGCFCGGFNEGDVIELDWRDDIEVPPECSTRLGGKLASVPDPLAAALISAYRVVIQTGTDFGAGTDDEIIIELRDANGTILASDRYQGDLENGATDIVYLRSLRIGGDVASVTISRTGSGAGNFPDWQLDSVMVQDRMSGGSVSFAVDQWIEVGQQYVLD